MKILPNARKLHRKIAPILFLPLLLSALTGLSYRVGMNWLGMSNALGNFILTIHAGGYLGEALAPIYILLVGFGLVGMIVTGLTMLKPKTLLRQNQSIWPIPNARRLHRYVAPIFFLPLFVSASTGVIYCLGKAWFGLSAELSNLILILHQGTYLGPFGRAIYVVSIGLGLLTLLVSGINMTGIFRRRSVKP